MRHLQLGTLDASNCEDYCYPEFKNSLIQWNVRHRHHEPDPQRPGQFLRLKANSRLVKPSETVAHLSSTIGRVMSLPREDMLKDEMFRGIKVLIGDLLDVQRMKNDVALTTVWDAASLSQKTHHERELVMCLKEIFYGESTPPSYASVNVMLKVSF